MKQTRRRKPSGTRVTPRIAAEQQAAVKDARSGRVKRRAAADAAYRDALGVPEGQPLPGQLGVAGSAGAARGGRGAASKGRGRFK